MQRKAEVLGRYPSKSSPDKVYTVKRITEAVEGEPFVWIGCDCPAFTRARKWVGIPSCDRDCRHTQLHSLDDLAVDEGTPLVQEPEIVYAKVRQVTPDGDGRLLVPLISMSCPAHLEATIVYDLLQHGVSWGECRERYDLAKRNSKQAIVGYVEERGRCIYGPNVGRWGFYEGLEIVLIRVGGEA